MFKALHGSTATSTDVWGTIAIKVGFFSVILIGYLFMIVTLDSQGDSYYSIVLRSLVGLTHL